MFKSQSGLPRVHLHDRDTVAARHPEWDTSEDLFLLEKPSIMAVGIGAAMARAGDDADKKQSAKNQEAQARKLAAAEAYSANLAAASENYTESMTRMNPVVKWFSRSVYSAGTVGLVYIAVYCITTGKFQ